MKLRVKSRFVMATAVLMLLTVSVTACSRNESSSDAKTVTSSGGSATSATPTVGMSPDDIVKQHRQQQEGQTAAPNSTSGTSSGQ